MFCGQTLKEDRGMIKARNIFSGVLSALFLALVLVSPAKADFFDDARQTLQKDVPHFFQNDVPHFFQDDIPCAFGGQPTSHTKKSCSDRGGSARRTSDKSAAPPATAADPRQETHQAPVQQQ
jgi:hypothetical protein